MTYPDYEDDHQQQKQDDEALHQATVEAIMAAHGLGLPETECLLLASSAGVTNEVYKELRK